MCWETKDTSPWTQPYMKLGRLLLQSCERLWVGTLAAQGWGQALPYPLYCHVPSAQDSACRMARGLSFQCCVHAHGPGG